MDLSKIKSRLDSMGGQAKSNSQNKDLFWKPSIGKQQIRVLPSKFNPDMPFTEMKFYYGIGKKVMPSPLNWGKKDPIVEFTKKLRNSNEKDNWNLAKKLDPKTRIFAPIIVRGEEDKGVRLWQFGKMVYESFLLLATDEEVGDYTDISAGRDIKLNTVGPEVTGTRYNKTTISPSLKQSPISDDKDMVNKFLEEQVDPLKLFKPLEFDEMKSHLEEWLSVDEESEGSISSEPVENFESDTPSERYSESTLQPKQTNEKKFEEIFNEDDSGEDFNDLPWDKE